MFARLLSTLLVLAATYGPAIAADAVAGKVIADRWCASCHMVAPDQPRANADVPSFAAIAAKYEDEKALANFLAAPYPRMPNMTLSRPEIADLIAYIRSQGSRRDLPRQLEKDDKPADPTRG